MSLTPAQQQALAARGNVLVVAGAGTGKTRTLVERVLHCLTAETPRVSLDEFLLVTFTEAAAAEMRQRIRVRLDQELTRNPGDPHWQEQIALFESAHLGTLHSFCLQLVREHFYELELDPQLTVLAEEEACLLAEETLDGLLERQYSGKGENAAAVQALIQTQGRGWDRPLRNLVLKLHRYSQTRPDADAWLKSQKARFSASTSPWLPDLLGALQDWRQRWLSSLQSAATEQEFAAFAVKSLSVLPSQFTRAEAAGVLSGLVAAGADLPRTSKSESLRVVLAFVEETRFFASLTLRKGTADPLDEDWAWIRLPMGTLVQLTADFGQAFADAKRELGVADFQDLEQHALRLLWDASLNKPTRIAQEWRRRLRFVFVDEYQDINSAQDQIIQALSRDGAEANRFLVGDVKQSIYRFRLANPRIFQSYIDQWRNGAGQAIPLVENFRSREALLNFTNALFTGLMRRELGGVPYDQQAALQFGAGAERHALKVTTQNGPCVELHLRLKPAADTNGADPAGEALDELRDLEETDKEARLVALQLRELKVRQHPVWDESANAFRPVDWADMAVLLRSPTGRADSYAKEFSRLQIPLQVARGGFYENLEILDLLNLLHLLDNPLQDLPALAVLRSPLVGLTVDELSTIRLAAQRVRFWTALVRWHETYKQEPRTSELYERISTFLERFNRWRRLARQVSLSRCLETILAESNFADWLLTQSRGEQRHANVRRLLSLAEQFDQFQRQGLFRFLRFIEAQQLAKTEPEVGTVSEQNAVRLMSIHQSKGLEFPVVAVGNLGKPFNVADLRAEIILDEEFGLCPQVKPPHTGRRYPSLPYWLARRRQKQELLGEELRLLYVALTRARDLLLLVGSTTQSRFKKMWQSPQELSPETTLSANSYADWLGQWFTRTCAEIEPGSSGENALLKWTIHDETSLVSPNAIVSPRESARPVDGAIDPATWKELEQRLAWTYPFAAATREPAKSSVTALRRQASAPEDDADPSKRVRLAAAGFQSRKRPLRHSKTGIGSAAEKGTAHHMFLERLNVAKTNSVAELKQEAQRLMRESSLTAEQFKLLDFESLAAFWNSDGGRRIREYSGSVHRELPFTARFNPEELSRIMRHQRNPALPDEFHIVQGVADLVVLRPEEIWLVDFKTDELAANELDARVKSYSPQLILYALALQKIYRKPVTRCWIYFLSAKQERAVAIADLNPSGSR